MLSIAKILITFFCIAIVMLLLRVANIRKDIRGRQILGVYISPVVALVGTVLAYVYFPRISAPGGDFFENSEVIIWNLIIAAAFIILKVILVCPISKLLWQKKSRMEMTSDTWYEYDVDLDMWFLKDKYVNIRSLLWNVSLTFSVITAVVLVSGWIAGRESLLWLQVFPCVALLITVELYNFLAGLTRAEYEHSVSGEDISTAHVGRLHKLRKVYEELFPESVLFSHTGNNYVGKQGATELLKQLKESSDPTERIVGRYFSLLNKKDGLFDVDYISASNNLLHKRSTVICNPFYRDLSDYLLLPLIHNLLNDKKCLVVVGRSALSDDITAWITDILKKYSRARGLWRVSVLGKEEADCEVGILSFAQLYNLKTHSANLEFFKQVSFVLLIEPSNMLTTSQSGLSILVDQMRQEEPPTYCVCDRDVDGIVDTLSHVLQVNLTDVVAAPVPRSVYTGIGWSASGDLKRQKLFEKETHYLGNGVEISSVALKNQVRNVTWLGAQKAPVKDIRWIAGQYYPQICKYAHLPGQQHSIDSRVSFTSNLWGSSVSDESFIIVEDEFCNLFATLRAYLTRGDKQSFVNVISESYLLRDYMRYNRQLFMTDPKAVPAIASYYAKTERNTIYRLILMMVIKPVAEEYVAHELSILGYETNDVYKTFSKLISRYTEVGQTIISVQVCQEYDEELMPIQVRMYHISEQVFEENFASTLKNAFFVVEDEKLDTEFIDARLFGHITQTVMPGQQLVYNGKLYRVSLVSPQAGCVLHRASDSYTGRRYYRQLRKYCFEPVLDVLKVRRIMDVEIAFERRNFVVTSSGYLELKDNHDLRKAKIIDLSDDPSIGSYSRSYKNKTVMRICLPEANENLRFTISVLLGEMLRSIFPDSWAYLAVLTTREIDEKGMLDKYIYHIAGDVDESMIYIVEDSDMDLGLLETIDNNIVRLFEIMSDYLTWHFEKMHEPPTKDPVPAEIDLPEDQNRKNFFSRMAKRIMRLFGASDEKQSIASTTESSIKDYEPDVDDVNKEGSATVSNVEEIAKNEEVAFVEEGESGSSVERTEALSDEIAELSDGFEMVTEESLDNNIDEDSSSTDASEPIEIDKSFMRPEEEIVLHTEGEDLFSIDGIPDDLDLLMPIKPSRYQKECFLKFGFDEIDARIAVEDVKSYLFVRGWGNNDLTKARTRSEYQDTLLDLQAENHCDFCGIPLSGVSYERLDDGRVRCHDCAMTSIDSLSEFRRLFSSTETLMENTFDITLKIPIAIRTTDAKTIARGSGSVFKPSTEFAERSVGYAQRKDGRYSIFIENGSPRLATIDTIVHELTHIWQYINWSDRQIEALYGDGSNRDMVYEGMATWVAIQMLYAMGETEYAKQQEYLTENREDIYGKGFCLYREKYGLVRDGDLPRISPFATFPPL